MVYGLNSRFIENFQSVSDEDIMNMANNDDLDTDIKNEISKNFNSNNNNIENQIIVDKEKGISRFTNMSNNYKTLEDANKSAWEEADSIIEGQKRSTKARSNYLKPPRDAVADMSNDKVVSFADIKNTNNKSNKTNKMKKNTKMENKKNKMDSNNMNTKVMNDMDEDEMNMDEDENMDMETDEMDMESDEMKSMIDRKKEDKKKKEVKDIDEDEIMNKNEEDMMMSDDVEEGFVGSGMSAKNFLRILLISLLLTLFLYLYNTTSVKLMIKSLATSLKSFMPANYANPLVEYGIIFLVIYLVLMVF